MPSTYLDINKDKGYGEVIEKIVEAKRAPTKKKEAEKKRLKLQVSVINELEKEVNLLDQMAGRLYGFNSIFGDYKLTSDAPDFLSGSAKRTAKIGDYSV
ncbi:MAG: hypothetical protein JNM63_11075 [Spirochaetia bacterium]|nr:hypothetical protein [Spirochaetia bacterium]